MRVFKENLAQPIVAAHLQLQRELAYLILCALRQLSWPVKKARKYLAMQAFLLSTAVAHWVKFHRTQNLMWFFIEIRPLYTYRYF